MLRGGGDTFCFSSRPPFGGTMKNISKAIIVLLTVALALSSVSLISPSQDISAVTPAGNDLSTEINAAESDSDLTLDLSANAEYTIGGTFKGNSLVINGAEGAKIKIDGNKTLSSSNPNAAVTFNNVTIVSPEPTESNGYAQYTFSISNFGAIEMNECSTQYTIYRMSGDSSVTSGIYISNSTFTGNDTINKLYAVSAFSNIVALVNVDFSGYSRGIDIDPVDRTGNMVMLSGCDFSDINGKCAIQFAGNIGGNPVVFSGCTFKDCETAVSIHESSKGEGYIASSGNTYADCGTEFLYCGSGSPVTMLSTEDTFTDNGAATQPSSEGESGSVTLPDTPVTTSEWYKAGDSLTIDSPDDLVEFSTLYNKGVWFIGIEIQLGADIDMKGIEWTPIGTEERPYSGKFIGNGHTISNLSLSLMNAEGTDEDVYLGLFGYVEGTPNFNFTNTTQVYGDNGYDESVIDIANYETVIRDIVIENISIVTNGSCVGSLAGYAGNAHISGIHVESGSIVGATSVGGVIGIGYSVVINGCSTGSDLSLGSGNESKSYNIGGIAGCVRGYDGYPSLVTGCVNEASVSGKLTAGGLAGIVGHINNYVPVVVYNCQNHGSVTVDCSVDIDNTHKGSVGGIVGYFQGNNSSTMGDNLVVNCINTGKVSTSEESKTTANLSGIVGQLYAGSIISCENRGEIFGDAVFVGGVLGQGAVDKQVVIDGCSGSGTTSNASEYGFASPIAAGSAANDHRAIVYRNMTFGTTADLQEALPQGAVGTNTLETIGASVLLENVNVNELGELEIPERVFTFAADGPVASTVTYIGPPGTDGSVSISIPDSMVVVDEPLKTLTLGADGMSVFNNSEIGTIYIIDGDGISVTNLGTLGSVDDNMYRSDAEVKDKSGTATITIYNGTAENKNAHMGKVVSYYLNTEFYNYGTMESNDYLLRAGFAVGNDTPGIVQNNTFNAYNYGTMMGTRDDGGHRYMFYVPAAKEFNFINYQGSVLNNKGVQGIESYERWFMYYGLDGKDGSTATENKGIMTFIVYPETIKCDDKQYPEDGNFTYDALMDRMVGTNDGDAGFAVQQLSADTEYVTFEDGFGESQNVPLINGVPKPIPTFTKPGLEFFGWNNEDYQPSSIHVADWDIADVVPVVSVDVSNPIIGQTVKLTANITEYEYLDYTYTWTIGGSTFNGKTIQYTIKSESTSYALAIHVVPKVQYTAIITDYSDSSQNFTLNASEAPVYEVTFKVNVSDYDVTVKDSNGNTIEPVDNAYKLPNGDYTAVFTKVGYQDETVKFTVQNSNRTVSVDMKPVDTPDPEPEPDPDNPEPDTPEINPPSSDDDEPLPPVIRPGGSSSSSDNDTVTIVACAAAAAVAAIMAVFLIVLYRKD